ncbi:MAG: thiamine pyrophosphate-binding protein [Gemmatimonadota bacterium]
MSTRAIHTLVQLGVTHVVGIPDNTSGPLFHETLRHPTLRLVTATREGEAIAIASGLWLGGASPIVVIQNTGLLESGDAIRGTALRMRAAIPMVVTARGYAKMAAAGFGPDTPKTVDNLTRPDVDSTALLTEPTLDAWGVPFRVCGPEDDPSDELHSLVETARSDERPVAMILNRPLE